MVSTFVIKLNAIISIIAIHFLYEILGNGKEEFFHRNQIFNNECNMNSINNTENVMATKISPRSCPDYFN